MKKSVKKTIALTILPTLPSTKKRFKQINLTVEIEFNPKASKADIAYAMKSVPEGVENFNFTAKSSGLKMLKLKKGFDKWEFEKREKAKK